MKIDISQQTPVDIPPTVDEMNDAAYWQRLLPEFCISEQPFHSHNDGYHFSDNQADLLCRQIRKEGYFQSNPIIPPSKFKPLADGIARIDQAKCLPLFLAVYDEFWQLLHSLRKTFTLILGEHYQLSPDFWIWHVHPNESSRGWGFHRDTNLARPFDAHARIREDGRPKLCTIWIPLTDATTHNSCIYVLPFPHDPSMQSFMRKESLEKIQQAGQLTDWTNIRALPAQAGSVLGWTPYIAHWGSRSTEWATHARVSIGIYYQAIDAPTVGRPPFPEGFQHIDHHSADLRVSFEDRLRIIASILSAYSQQMTFEPNFAPAVYEFCQHWK